MPATKTYAELPPNFDGVNAADRRTARFLADARNSFADDPQALEAIGHDPDKASEFLLALVQSETAEDDVAPGIDDSIR